MAAAWNSLVNVLGPDLARIVIGLVGVLGFVDCFVVRWISSVLRMHITRYFLILNGLVGGARNLSQFELPYS